jgi:rifampicin phosphotransferase
MSPVIRWLQDVAADQAALVGGKAANLGRLVRMDLPVPAGFVVTTEAYRTFLTATDLDQLDPDPDTLRQRILKTPLPIALSTPILSAYRALNAPAVAVRSSGTAEDLAAASFAGQHDSFLNISGPAAVLTAVQGCWASLWSPRAVDYRRQRGWEEQDLALAVVVQAMVPAQWAGVLFTADPVTGQRDRVIIEAVSGLGEALVSGERSGERLVVEKATMRILEGNSLLPAEAFQELARLGTQIETSFGEPQDIEWAYAQGHLSILQARPMTALPEEKPRRSPRRYSRLQRAGAPNAIEHMPVPPYPFDYSLFFRPGLERGFRALRSLGFATPAIEEVYVPIADGVVQMVPPAIRPTLRALALPGKLVSALRARPEEWLAECHRTLVVTAQQIDAEELPSLSEQHLLERIQRLRDLQLDLLVRRFGYFPAGALASQGLSFLLRRIFGKDAPRVQADLLAAIPCTTTESSRELALLAREIRAEAALHHVFLDEPPEQIADRLRPSSAGRAIAAQVDAFLRRYGYRETTMPSAALPAWRDEPSLVYGLLKALVAGEPSTTALETGGTERAEQAKHAVEAALSRGWFGLKRRLLLPLFHRLLAASRSFVAFREDSHFYLMLPFTVVRRLALALGGRLVQRGGLDEAADIFFLELDELTRLGLPEAVRKIAQQRKAARRSVAGRYTSVPADLLAPSTHPDEVRGVAASPGQAIGKVRIVLSERDFGTLEKGEVLVARYTNPTWTPLFGLASAVVVDAGSAASHTAIVAREYGIPAVMGSGNATTRLRTGQRVLVDGSAGRVVPVGPAAQPVTIGGEEEGRL